MLFLLLPLMIQMVVSVLGYEMPEQTYPVEIDSFGGVYKMFGYTDLVPISTRLVCVLRSG
jgi:hypothetical protein